MKSIPIVGMILFLLAACGKNPEPGPAPVPVPTPTPVSSSVQIGTSALPGMSYSWDNSDSLDNPKIAQPVASPKKSTLYTVTVKTECGTATSSVMVKVFQKDAHGVLVEVK